MTFRVPFRSTKSRTGSAFYDRGVPVQSLWHGSQGRKSWNGDSDCPDTDWRSPGGSWESGQVSGLSNSSRRLPRHEITSYKFTAAKCLKLTHISWIEIKTPEFQNAENLQCQNLKFQIFLSRQKLISADFRHFKTRVFRDLSMVKWLCWRHFEILT